MYCHFDETGFERQIKHYTSGFSEPVISRRTSKFSRYAPILVLAIGLILTFAITAYLIRTTRAADERQMENAAHRVSQVIEDRLGHYISLLRAGAALFVLDEDLTEHRLREFVSGLRLERDYPGIKGIGFAQRLSEAQWAEFVEDYHALDPEFDLKGTGGQDEYFPVVFFESLHPHELAPIGHDMFSDPVLNQAMTGARNADSAVASGIVRMANGDPGFLIYVPAYSGGPENRSNNGARLDRFLGFVFSPFHGKELLEGVIWRPRVQFNVYDGEPSPDNLLYESSTVAGHKPRFTVTEQIEIAGRSWSIVSNSTPALEKTSSRALIPWISGAGLAFTLVLFGITRTLTATARQAEQSRREEAVQRQRLRTTLESISDGFIRFDPEWRFTYLNSRAAEMLGRKPEELLGMKVSDANLDPATHEITALLLKTAGNGKRTGSEVYSSTLKAWLGIQAYPSNDGLSVYFQDISERKLNEEQRERRARQVTLKGEIEHSLRNGGGSPEDLFQRCAAAVVRSLPCEGAASLWVFDPATGNMTRHASPEWTPNEADLVHERRLMERVTAGRSPSVSNDSSPDHSSAIPELTTSGRWSAFAGYPLLVEDRLLGAMTVFCTGTFPDDTLETISSAARFIALEIERKRAEKELARSEEKFRTIVRSATDYAIYTLDKKGIITSWNPGAERIMGYREAEMVGRSSRLLWSARDREQGVPEKELGDAEQKGGSIDERWHQRKDGQSFWASGTLVPLRSSSGQVYGFLKILRDLTERKRMEEALKEAREELSQHAEHLEETVAERTARLRELLGEMETFSYSISHDMRAPLRAIRGMAQVLLEDYGGKIGPEGADYVHRLISAAVRLDNLIQDVLAYSRLVRSEIILQPVSLEKVLREITQHNPELQATRAEFRIKHPLLDVMGQEAPLTQCITNLLSNGVKFVSPHVRPRVEIWTEPQGSERVRLFIKDNGIGIEPDHQQRIFQMFERIHPQTTFSGTGIGLPIVRKAVERMAGAVGLESEPGKGSTFWVELSAAPKEDSDGAA